MVVGIELLEQIAIVEASDIFGINDILADTLEARQSTYLFKLGLRRGYEAVAALAACHYRRCGRATFQDVGVGAERVVVVVTSRYGVDLLHKVIRGHLVVRRVEIGGVEHLFIERQIAILQHVENTLSNVLGIGAGQVEHRQTQTVCLALHFTRAVMVLDKIAHLLRFGLYIVAVVLAARYFLKAVLAQVVHDFVADNEGQLSLVFNLRHKACAHKHHSLTGSESVDIGRLERIETQLAPQFRIVLEQCVGYAFHHTRNRVAIEYAPRRHSAVDLVSGSKHLVAITKTTVVIVAHALFVKRIEFFERKPQIGRHRSFRFNSIETVKIVHLLPECSTRSKQHCNSKRVT